MTQIYFSSHSLLLIITQCSFLIYSLCSFETIGMPFNFQPAIFRAKMQYNRPCKYSRPCTVAKEIVMVNIAVIRQEFGKKEYQNKAM